MPDAPAPGVDVEADEEAYDDSGGANDSWDREPPKEDPCEVVDDAADWPWLLVEEECMLEAGTGGARLDGVNEPSRPSPPLPRPEEYPDISRSCAVPRSIARLVWVSCWAGRGREGARAQGVALAWICACAGAASALVWHWHVGCRCSLEARRVRKGGGEMTDDFNSAKPTSRRFKCPFCPTGTRARVSPA